MKAIQPIKTKRNKKWIIDKHVQPNITKILLYIISQILKHCTNKNFEIKQLQHSLVNISGKQNPQTLYPYHCVISYQISNQRSC